MKLNQFDYFRVIAILLVVFSHTAQVLLDVYSNNSFTNALIFNLVGGATALFVFISGFFFHYVFYQKFEFKTFLIKKAKGVYAPYLFLTTIAFIGICIKVALKSTPSTIMEKGAILETVYQYLGHVLNGSISIQFWYIPFIMLMFIASPIFIAYIKSATPLRIGIMLLLFLSSLLIHRPLDGGHSIHAFFFYLPVYMFGINCSIHRERLNNAIQNKSMIFGGLVILMAVIQLIIFDHIGNYQKEDPFALNGISLMLIQKILLIFFFLSFLQKYEQKESKLLKEIAAASFAIYFLHMIALQGLLKLKADALLSFSPDLISWLMISGMAIFICYVVARAVKYTFKRNSKLFIGW